MERGCLKRFAVLTLSAALAGSVLAIALPAVAEPTKAAVGKGWHQWRGPQRNGISAETGWLAKWPEGGPKQAWQRTIGAGYGTVAVSNGRVYVMGNAKNVDTVWCLSAGKGDVIWKRSYPCRIGGYPGPRSTPTVDGEVLYTVSRQGDVNCFKAADGETVWSKNVASAVGAKAPGWGVAGSALVEGDLLIVNIGTAGVALKKATGEVVWKTGSGKSGFASPVRFDMGGRRCVLIFAAKALVCVDLKSGQRLWSLPWETEYDVNAADPIVIGERIFISSGYNRGCALLDLADGKPSIVWENRNMRNHFSSCVLYKGHLYGADGNTGLQPMSGQAVVKCMDPQTGEVKWSSGRLYMASLMLADEKLIIQGDGGRLIVAEASPERFKVISQARVLSGSCWTMPVLAEGRIYCRNNKKGELVCLDVQAK